jgi:hypothetical protein
MKSAAVIPHPRAAAEPVKQTRGPGRRPKTVISFRDHRYRRWCDDREREVVDEKIASLRSCLETLEEARADMIDALLWLQRTDLSDKERAVAVQYIEWESLPWQEKERQKALGWKVPERPY